MRINYFQLKLSENPKTDSSIQYAYLLIFVEFYCMLMDLFGTLKKRVVGHLF